MAVSYLEQGHGRNTTVCLTDEGKEVAILSFLRLDAIRGFAVAAAKRKSQSIIHTRIKKS